MRKRIILNDQGLYVDCILENSRISFEFENSLSTLNDKVKVIKEGDISYGLLGLKRFVRIYKDKVSKVMNVTTTELRVLCALSNRVDYLIENLNEKNIDIVGEFNKVLKTLLNLPKDWDKNQLHKTELHTHFTEILNPKEFVDFINQYGVTYPIDENGNLDFKNGESVTYEELVRRGLEEKLLDSLRLDVSSQTSFNELTDVVNYRRKELIDRIIKYNGEQVINRSSISKEELDDLEYYISELKIKMSDEEIYKLGLSKKEKGAYKNKLNTELNNLISKRKRMVSDILYSDLMNASLDKLTRENIEYSEISFSNEKRLEYLSQEYKYDNRFNLLYSIHRTHGVSEYRKSSKILERLLNTSKVVGVDIMGEEKPIIEEEYNEFKDKIAWLLPVLHMHPQSVLRIHASEFKDATDNMFITLKIIDELSKEINDACSDLFGREWGVIPPPRIRIGHGVNIRKNPELVRLIKKYDVVVEINASSNYALGHIKSVNDIPLDYYNENGIKYVISTDGGGVYSTSIHQEENLLKSKIQSGDSLNTELDEMKPFGSGKSSSKDKELYKLYRNYQEQTIEEHTSNSYMEALDEEKKYGEGKTDKELVIEEMNDLSLYLMDMDTDFDRDYYRNMISLITRLNEKERSDISKIYLYLLEREITPKKKTVFKTVEYLDSIKNKKDITDQLEKSLVRVFNVVRGEYLSESRMMKEYIEDYNSGGRRK